MAVTDKKMDNAANTARHPIVIPITTATGAAGVTYGSITPGFRFQVTKVSVFALTVTATITVDVKIGSTSVLTGAVTPVAATETAGTLSSTLANLRGTSSNALNIVLTTNGSGAATQLQVYVWVRPYPMNQDAAL